MDGAATENGAQEPQWDTWMDGNHGAVQDRNWVDDDENGNDDAEFNCELFSHPDWDPDNFPEPPAGTFPDDGDTDVNHQASIDQMALADSWQGLSERSSRIAHRRWAESRLWRRRQVQIGGVSMSALSVKRLKSTRSTRSGWAAR